MSPFLARADGLLRRPSAHAVAAMLLLAILFSGFAVAPARAQSCWVNQGLDIAFGTVGSSGQSTTNRLTVTCNRGSGKPSIAYRICMFIPEGSPIPGLDPRWMTNYNGAQMAYDLYADPARSRPIPSTTTGNGDALHTAELRVQSNTTGEQGTVDLHVYASTRPGQTLPAMHPFQSQIHGGRIRYAYNEGTPGNPPAVPPPERCLSGGVGEVAFYTHVSASFANSCRITTATDLDFGAVTTLAGPRDQTSTIQLQCPSGTTWRVGLDNGLHASGDARRMAGPGGRYLRYELYRDPQRQQRWGRSLGSDTSQGTGTNATQSLTVYGRVLPQPTPGPGGYADTVTITLTY